MFTLRQYSDNPVKKEFTNFPFYNENGLFFDVCVCVCWVCAQNTPPGRKVGVCWASQYFLKPVKKKELSEHTHTQKQPLFRTHTRKR